MPEPISLPPAPEQLPGLAFVTRPDEAESAVVFIHGLGGDCLATWGPKDAPGTFLTRLAADLPDTAVASYGYSSGAKRAFEPSRLDVQELARVWAHELRDDFLERYSSVAVVCHSLWGVITQAAVRHLLSTEPSWGRRLRERERHLAVVLMGVPQHGTDRARGTGWLSNELAALTYNGELVRQSTEFWQGRVRPPKEAVGDDAIPIASFAVVSEQDAWVPQISAGAGLAERSVKRVAGSHTGMVKPPGMGAFAPYDFVLARLREWLRGPAPAPEVEREGARHLPARSGRRPGATPGPLPSLFISYSRADEAWVEVLHRNLTRAFEEAGDTPGRIFFDQVSIVPGMSWVGRLDQGLAESDKMVLVVTPESIASMWANEESRAHLAGHVKRSSRSLIPVLLRWTPQPPLIAARQAVDFRYHDDAGYRRAFGQLLDGLRDAPDLLSPPALPLELAVPERSPDPLGEPLRRQVVGWLEGLLSNPAARLMAPHLGLEPALLDELSPELAATVSLVRLSGDGESPQAALLAALTPLRPAMDGLAGHLGESLDTLLADLERATAPPAVEPEPVSPLPRWLRRVREDTEEIDSYLALRLKASSFLDRVYVRRRVAESSPAPPADGRTDPGEERAAGGAGTLEGLLAASLRPPSLEAEDSSPSPVGRWVILGEPGAGKTTLLRHLAWECTQRDDLPWIPLLVRIPDALAAEDWLTDWLEANQEKRHRIPGLADFLEQEAKRQDDNRFLVLLDGLDEVAAEHRTEAHRWLKSLLAAWPRARFVVSSRPVPYEPLGDGFEELEVQPLGRDGRIELVARYLSAHDEPTETDLETATGHVADLERDPWLWEWAGNPLYLTFIALLLRQGERPSIRRHELYRQVVDLLLSGEHRPDAVRMPAETTRQVLARLAHEMTEGGKAEVTDGDVEEHLLDADLGPLVERLRRASERYRGNLLAFRDDLKSTGLFAPYAYPRWRFLHRTFQEALTAERMAVLAEGPEGREALLARARGLATEETSEEDLTRWAEPYALLVGRIDERDALVTALVEANRSLGLRALGGAYGLSRATLKRVLGELDGWRERIEVYRALPRVIEPPGEVLDLIDELRRDTRDGNDLFWLDRAARQVARRHRELEARVEELLAGFYEHIPAPAEGLFPVDLWRPIPAGEFWMGSAEEEEGRYDWEGPRHRVEVRSSFRMAAVPVTRLQYAAFDPTHRSYGFENDDDEELAQHPVNEVTWYAAVSFCRWLSRALPWTAGARLPTEGEWEYACRAGSETAYCKGGEEEHLAEVGWYVKNSESRTHRVGELPANEWGLHDVHGNVWEWTLSPWTDDYAERADGAVEDPSAVSVEELIGDDPGGGWRVNRGGSFAIPARFARSAFRGWDLPRGVWRFLGFRVALPAAPSDGR